MSPQSKQNRSWQRRASLSEHRWEEHLCRLLSPSKLRQGRLMAKKYEVRNEGMRMPSTKLFDLVPRVLSLSPSREEERGPWEQGCQPFCVLRYFYIKPDSLISRYYHTCAFVSLKMISELSRWLWTVGNFQLCVSPLTPMTDQDWISPYNINIGSTRRVIKIKKHVD